MSTDADAGASTPLSVDEVLDRLCQTLQDQHYLALQRERYRWLLQQVLKMVPHGGRIADVGAAPGHMSLALKSLGYDVTAFDFAPDEDMWEDAPAGSFSGMMRSNGIAIKQWNVEVLDPQTVPPQPDREGEYDAVIFTEVLEHIYHYPFASVRQTAHLLKRGGLMFVTTPNRGYAGCRLRALFGKSIDTGCNLLVDNFPPHMRHVWMYDLDEVQHVLQSASLEPTLAEVRSFHLWTTSCGPREILPYWKPNSVKQVLKLPLALFLAVFPKLGSTVCVVARKK